MSYERFIKSVTNPSPALVLAASCGWTQWVPVGHEVQWWHHGEDGTQPRLVDLRGPMFIAGQCMPHFGELQEWAAEEMWDVLWDEAPAEPDWTEDDCRRVSGAVSRWLDNDIAY